MADRAYKLVSIVATAVAQPLMYSTVTAIVLPTQQPYGQGTGLVSVPVADSSLYRNGDHVVLVDTAYTLSKLERVRVFDVPDATHIRVQGLTIARAVGDFVILSIVANVVYVQPRAGNAAEMAIGVDKNSLIATGQSLRVILEPSAAASQPPDWSSSRTGGASNPVNSSDYWIVGTINDKYLPSLGLV